MQALAGTKVHVMAAFGTDLQIALQLDAIQHRSAFLALAPQAFGNLVLVAAVGADAGGNEFFVPAHATGSGLGKTSGGPVIGMSGGPGEKK